MPGYHPSIRARSISIPRGNTIAEMICNTIVPAANVPNTIPKNRGNITVNNQNPPAIATSWSRISGITPALEEFPCETRETDNLSGVDRPGDTNSVVATRAFGGVRIVHDCLGREPSPRPISSLSDFGYTLVLNAYDGVPSTVVCRRSYYRILPIAPVFWAKGGSLYQHRHRMQTYGRLEAFLCGIAGHSHHARHPCLR